MTSADILIGRSEAQVYSESLAGEKGWVTKAAPRYFTSNNQDKSRFPQYGLEFFDDAEEGRASLLRSLHNLGLRTIETFTGERVLLFLKMDPPERVVYRGLTDQEQGLLCEEYGRFLGEKPD